MDLSEHQALAYARALALNGILLITVSVYQQNSLVVWISAALFQIAFARALNYYTDGEDSPTLGAFFAALIVSSPVVFVTILLGRGVLNIWFSSLLCGIEVVFGAILCLLWFLSNFDDDDYEVRADAV